MASLSGTVLGLTAGVVMPYWLAVLFSLLCSVLVGMLCGVLSFKVGLPSFVTTLGVSKVIEGTICLLVNNVTLVNSDWPSVFSWVSKVTIGVVPVVCILFVAMAALIWFMFAKTKVGRYISATGANPVCCAQVGINPLKIKILAFCLSGALSGLAGVLNCSNLASVPLLPGGTIMLTAIPAAMLGATFAGVR